MKLRVERDNEALLLSKASGSSSKEKGASTSSAAASSSIDNPLLLEDKSNKPQPLPLGSSRNDDPQTLALVIRYALPYI